MEKKFKDPNSMVDIIGSQYPHNLRHVGKKLKIKAWGIQGRGSHSNQLKKR